MKILITGAAGMLAAAIIPELKKRKHQVFLTDINQRLPEIKRLDIVNSNEILECVAALKPDFLFHLAAATDVDLCENEPDYAFRVNTLGTENIVLSCLKLNIPLLYISTGAIFNGDKSEPYTEFDAPDPVNIYGRSKLQGEIIVKNMLSRYFILRAGWMVGGWDIDKKFVYKIVTQLKEGKKELNVVADKFGSPTFTEDFARNLFAILETERYGIYHMANKGVCSRYDMALRIVKCMGLERAIKVNSMTSDQFPLPAPRANSEMLRNYKLDLLGINHMPFWEESLERYISNNRDL